MNRLIIFFALLFLSTTLFAKNDDEHQIRSIFDKFKSSLIKNNGSNSYEFIDKNSKDYLDSIIYWAHTADYDMIHEKKYIDKYFILSLRSQVEKEKIVQLKPENLIATLIQYNILEFQLFFYINLGNISIKKNHANAKLMVNGQLVKDEYKFILEDKNWRIDLLQVFKIENTQKTKNEKKKNYLEVDAIIEFIEQKFETKIDKNIFDPIKK